MKHANHMGWSDVTPYEVIRVVSEKTLEIRAMHYERDKSVKLDIQPGGFAWHCSNQEQQKWHITPDEKGTIRRIRLGKRGWKDSHGGRYDLSESPSRFYDYNF